MAPFADAMHLIDCQQGQAHIIFHLVQQVEEILAQKPLWRHVKQLQPAGYSCLFSASSFSGAERAIDERSRDTIDSQAVYLVVHQRDQWRDYYGQPRHHKSRQLIGERFSAAGRHQNERIATS